MLLIEYPPYTISSKNQNATSSNTLEYPQKTESVPSEDDMKKISVNKSHLKFIWKNKNTEQA